MLAGVDGSRASLAAAVWAAVEASSRSLPLCLMHVHDLAPLAAPQPFLMVEGTTDGQLLRPAEQWLDRFADACRRIAGIDLAVRTEVVVGKPADVLASRAEQAGLLVLGSSGVSGAAESRLGSVATALVHRLEQPIVVVRGDNDEATPRRPVLVGIDESGRNERVVEFAFDLAHRRGRELVALHAWEQDLARGSRFLADVVAPWQHLYPDVVVRLEVTPDHPVDALLDRSKGAGVLVLGSHGRGQLRRLILGAVSHAVTQNAACSVAIVRGAS